MPWPAPLPVTIFVVLTAVASISVAFIDTAIATFFPTISLGGWLALSTWGLRHYYLWQLVTHIFVYPSYGDLTLSYLLELAFLLYTLWIMGAEVCPLIGARSFTSLYLGVGTLAGLAAVLLGPAGSLVQGPAASLLAIFTLWTMISPQGVVLLFFLIPTERRWLFLGLCAGLLLVGLAHGDLTLLLWYLSGVAGGYLYGTMAWQLSGPFTQTASLDRQLYRLARYLEIQWARLTRRSTPTTPTNSRPKILDFTTGQPPLDDDAFVDAMLAKIARQGEKALSWQERQRLQQISATKRTHESDEY